MGESACLLRSFSHPSDASREPKEVCYLKWSCFSLLGFFNCYCFELISCVVARLFFCYLEIDGKWIVLNLDMMWFDGFL